MSFSPGKDWSKESDDLFIHKSGVRITKTTYHQKQGWFLMPTDLDQAVLEFAATDEGREQAFEAFAKGAVSKRVVKKVKPKKKGVEAPQEEEQAEAAEGAGEGGAAPAAEADEADEDEEEEEEEEEADVP